MKNKPITVAEAIQLQSNTVGLGAAGFPALWNVMAGQPMAQPATERTDKVAITNMPQGQWVFKTLSMGGWDYEGNPILVVATLEMVRDENTGKLRGSNVIFDFVDPKKPSNRVCVMTDSLIEVLGEIKGAYDMERLAEQK